MLLPSPCGILSSSSLCALSIKNNVTNRLHVAQAQHWKQNYMQSRGDASCSWVEPVLNGLVILISGLGLAYQTLIDFLQAVREDGELLDKNPNRL